MNKIAWGSFALGVVVAVAFAYFMKGRKKVA